MQLTRSLTTKFACSGAAIIGNKSEMNQKSIDLCSLGALMDLRKSVS